MSEDRLREDVKKKGVLGVLYFLGNSSYGAGLGLIANFFFTIYLTPAEYGLYFIVLSLITIFTYFTDLGFAASLVQKKDPEEEEFYIAFTIQLLLVTTVVTVGVILTPLLIAQYKLTTAGIGLYIAMLVSLFILSLKSIPSTRLERTLEYSKIVMTQAVEQTLFYTVSIIFLLLHFGVYALAIAVVIRSLVGVSLIYYFTGWRPRIKFNMARARSILKFGIPFQSNVFLAIVKDELLNMYLVQQLGFSAMGYVGWAKKWAEAPLRVVLDNTNRVMFPIFSRYQDDKERVGKTLEKVVFYNSLILLPVLAGIYIIMPLLVEIIPKYQKWETALSSFNFFLISALFVSFTTPFITVFNSIGKVIYSVRFMVLWIILNWTVVPVSIMFMGFQGVGVAFAINSLSFVFVIYVLKRLVPFHFWASVRMPITATAGMLVCLLLIKSSVFDPYILTATLVITGPIIYGLLLYLMGGAKAFHEVKHIFLQPATQ